MKRLLAEGAAVNAADSQGRTPLHQAAQNGHHEVFLQDDIDVVQQLLAAGAGVHAPDAACRVPLHEAARSGSLPVVQVLLQAGVVVHATDHNGYTPLHTTCMRRGSDADGIYEQDTTGVVKVLLGA